MGGRREEGAHSRHLRRKLPLLVVLLRHDGIIIVCCAYRPTLRAIGLVQIELTVELPKDERRVLPLGPQAILG